MYECYNRFFSKFLYIVNVNLKKNTNQWNDYQWKDYDLFLFSHKINLFYILPINY